MLNVKSFGLATGVSWGIYVFCLALIAGVGPGVGLVHSLGTVYIGFQPGFVGAMIGLVYGFLDGLIGGAIFAYLYNLFEKK
ncbi:MAG: bacteriophage holin [Candidatus Micrarchaeota archaeon]